MDLICLDTNILIDHRRAKDKTQTRLLELSKTNFFAIKTITVYELFRGDDGKQDKLWMEFFNRVAVLDFTPYRSVTTPTCRCGSLGRKFAGDSVGVGVEPDLMVGVLTDHSVKRKFLKNISVWVGGCWVAGRWG